MSLPCQTDSDAPASSAAPAAETGTAHSRASTSSAPPGTALGPPDAALAAPAAHFAEPAAHELADGLESPRLVIRGESSLPDKHVAYVYRRPIAHIDWLAFTVTPPPKLELPWLWPQLREMLNVYELVQRRSGWCGYAKSFDMGKYGLVASEGQYQHRTIHVSLNASGCAGILDWEHLKDWLEKLGASITRVDLAHDDLKGEAVSVDKALSWYLAGGFASGGRSPSVNRHGDWDNLREGRTLYIGKRKNGKLLRVYEKGKQLGDPDSPWTRAELELRNRNRIIPYDVLIDPGTYLSGSFACLNFLSTHQEKIRTIQKTNEISLATATRSAKSSCGKLINVLMHKHCGDAVAVVNDLIRPGVPRRLVTYSDFMPSNTTSDKQP